MQGSSTSPTLNYSAQIRSYFNNKQAALRAWQEQDWTPTCYSFFSACFGGTAEHDVQNVYEREEWPENTNPHSIKPGIDLDTELVEVLEDFESLAEAKAYYLPKVEAFVDSVQDRRKLVELHNLITSIDILSNFNKENLIFEFKMLLKPAYLACYFQARFPSQDSETPLRTFPHLFDVACGILSAGIHSKEDMDDYRRTRTTVLIQQHIEEAIKRCEANRFSPMLPTRQIECWLDGGRKVWIDNFRQHERAGSIKPRWQSVCRTRALLLPQFMLMCDNVGLPYDGIASVSQQWIVEQWINNLTFSLGENHEGLKENLKETILKIDLKIQRGIASPFDFELLNGCLSKLSEVISLEQDSQKIVLDAKLSEEFKAMFLRLVSCLTRSEEIGIDIFKLVALIEKFNSFVFQTPLQEKEEGLVLEAMEYLPKNEKQDCCLDLLDGFIKNKSLFPGGAISEFILERLALYEKGERGTPEGTNFLNYFSSAFLYILSFNLRWPFYTNSLEHPFNSKNFIFFTEFIKYFLESSNINWFLEVLSYRIREMPKGKVNVGFCFLNSLIMVTRQFMEKTPKALSLFPLGGFIEKCKARKGFERSLLGSLIKLYPGFMPDAYESYKFQTSLEAMDCYNVYLELNGEGELLKKPIEIFGNVEYIELFVKNNMSICNLAITAVLKQSTVQNLTFNIRYYVLFFYTLLNAKKFNVKVFKFLLQTLNSSLKQLYANQEQYLAEREKLYKELHVIFSEYLTPLTQLIISGHCSEKVLRSYRELPRLIDFLHLNLESGATLTAQPLILSSLKSLLSNPEVLRKRRHLPSSEP